MLILREKLGLTWGVVLSVALYGTDGLFCGGKALLAADS